MPAAPPGGVGAAPLPAAAVGGAGGPCSAGERGSSRGGICDAWELLIRLSSVIGTIDPRLVVVVQCMKQTLRPRGLRGCKNQRVVRRSQLRDVHALRL